MSFWTLVRAELWRRPERTIFTIVSLAAGFLLFDLLNAMFSAVRRRRTEIATLRAIGFGETPVIASVVIEALFLGVVGALLGALAASQLIDGATVSTMMSMETFSHIAFGLKVGSRSVLIGVLFALGITLAAGVFAARQASRISIAARMQES